MHAMPQYRHLRYASSKAAWDLHVWRDLDPIRVNAPDVEWDAQVEAPVTTRRLSVYEVTIVDPKGPEAVRTVSVDLNTK